MATYSRSVTFEHTFKLPGSIEVHPAGTFELRVEEEPLDVMWEAYHTRMVLILPSGGRMEAWALSEDDLKAALASDRASIVDSGFS